MAVMSSNLVFNVTNIPTNIVQSIWCESCCQDLCCNTRFLEWTFDDLVESLGFSCNLGKGRKKRGAWV